MSLLSFFGKKERTAFKNNKEADSYDVITGSLKKKAAKVKYKDNIYEAEYVSDNLGSGYHFTADNNKEYILDFAGSGPGTNEKKKNYIVFEVETGQNAGTGQLVNENEASIKKKADGYDFVVRIGDKVLSDRFGVTIVGKVVDLYSDNEFAYGVKVKLEDGSIVKGTLSDWIKVSSLKKKAAIDNELNIGDQVTVDSGKYSGQQGKIDDLDEEQGIWLIKLPNGEHTWKPAKSLSKVASIPPGKFGGSTQNQFKIGDTVLATSNDEVVHGIIVDIENDSAFIELEDGEQREVKLTSLKKEAKLNKQASDDEDEEDYEDMREVSETVDVDSEYSSAVYYVSYQGEIDHNTEEGDVEVSIYKVPNNTISADSAMNGFQYLMETFNCESMDEAVKKADEFIKKHEDLIKMNREGKKKTAANNAGSLPEAVEGDVTDYLAPKANKKIMGYISKESSTLPDDEDNDEETDNDMMDDFVEMKNGNKGLCQRDNGDGTIEVDFLKDNGDGTYSYANIYQTVNKSNVKKTLDWDEVQSLNIKHASKKTSAKKGTLKPGDRVKSRIGEEGTVKQSFEDGFVDIEFDGSEEIQVVEEADLELIPDENIKGFSSLKKKLKMKISNESATAPYSEDHFEEFKSRGLSTEVPDSDLRQHDYKQVNAKLNEIVSSLEEMANQGIDVTPLLAEVEQVLESDKKKNLLSEI